MDVLPSIYYLCFVRLPTPSLILLVGKLSMCYVIMDVIWWSQYDVFFMLYLHVIRFISIIDHVMRGSHFQLCFKKKGLVISLSIFKV